MTYAHFSQSSFLFTLTIILCCHVTPSTALTRSFAQYKHFFPAWEYDLKSMLQDECKTSYEHYQNRIFTQPQVGYQVINCILETMPEFRKAELAAASVILGIAPSALQLLSASYVENAIMAFRRPGLAFLLAMSSSGVRPVSMGEFDDFISKMEVDASRNDFPTSFWASFATSAIEYFATAAAVANNAHLAYQLSIFAVCTFAPANDFLPAVWTASCVAIHLIGYVAIGLRVEVDTGKDKRIIGLRNWSWQKLRTEFISTPWQARIRLYYKRSYNGWFSAAISLLYIGTVLQALYGTIILSSLVFISVRDSTVIVLWLMASTLVTRGILIYELGGLRTDKTDFNSSGTQTYSSVSLEV